MTVQHLALLGAATAVLFGLCYFAARLLRRRGHEGAARACSAGVLILGLMAAVKQAFMFALIGRPGLLLLAVVWGVVTVLAFVRSLDD